MATGAPLKVFAAYRDTPMRRTALALSPGSLERYALFGLDELVARGAVVHHNLEHPPPAWARGASAVLNRGIYGAGGYGGDFASVLGSLWSINAADVIFSTVDTVGIPIALLRRLGLVRTPLVYVAVGLPERLVQLRRLQGLYRRALRDTVAVVSYAESEVEWLQGWLGPRARVVFVPFGVDTQAFRPVDRPSEFDVLSIGADPRRDFALLLRIAWRHPELSFRIVASADHVRALGEVPPNVIVESDIPLATVRDRLAAARVVALPVRENSYSGATTTLLQAMATAKPVVVSRTDAIARGYGLEDGVNCRLVPPGDEEAFEAVLLEVLTGADAATALGIRARRAVERSLFWERYTDALWNLVGG